MTLSARCWVVAKHRLPAPAAEALLSLLSTRRRQAWRSPARKTPDAYLSNFPASWENTGNFAYFASWDQSKSQNTPKITMCYERIPGALEQGSFASHQGIELGNQSLSGKELSWRSVGIVLKENKLCGS